MCYGGKKLIEFVFERVWYHQAWLLSLELFQQVIIQVWKSFSANIPGAGNTLYKKGCEEGEIIGIIDAYIC